MVKCPVTLFSLMLHQHSDLDICGLSYILYKYWIIVLFSGAFGGPGGSSNPDEDPDLTMSWFSSRMLTSSPSPSTPPVPVSALH